VAAFRTEHKETTLREHLGLAPPGRQTPISRAADAVLDNPVWAALTGPHAHLAERNGQAARYRADASLFAALADFTDAQAWRDLAGLIGPGAEVLLTGDVTAPAHWEVVGGADGVQMVASSGTLSGGEADDVETEPLGVDDVPEMLDLVARTEPGPFRPRTIELGRYLGIRRNGTLVAMAGERLRPPGWTEISAVCTDEAYRGQGLASRLMRALAAGIRARGDTPLLHASAGNTNAIRLYRSLGFTLRRHTTFMLVRAPAARHPHG
jgi:ribosomal protein S18 acetylase RimI-like enzyme